MRIALATRIAAYAADPDLAALQAAFGRAGASAEALGWDDRTVSWPRFDAVLLRATCGDGDRLPAFLDWCTRVAAARRLHNAPEAVRWNSDRHCLTDLADRGVPVLPPRFIAPGDAVALPDDDVVVVRPVLAADARDAAHYPRAQRALAERHLRTLLEAGRCAAVQGYAADARGGTAMVCIDGHVSHAVGIERLPRSADADGSQEPVAATAPPRVPSEAERTVAAALFSALPFATPLCACIELVPTPAGPLLLDVELVRPSLLLHADGGAADRLAAALLQRLQADAT